MNPKERKLMRSSMAVRTYALSIAFIGCIIAANYITTKFGLVPVGFGLMATAGTYCAGLSFVLRNALQDVSGKRWTFATIAIGIATSFLIADPSISIASAIAFGLSELGDFSVYTPLRKHGFIRASIAANVIGSLIDTAVFLTIAGFPLAAAMPGQMVGKLLVTAIAVTVVALYRIQRKAVAA